MPTRPSLSCGAGMVHVVLGISYHPDWLSERRCVSPKFPISMLMLELILAMDLIMVNIWKALKSPVNPSILVERPRYLCKHGSFRRLQIRGTFPGVPVYPLHGNPPKPPRTYLCKFSSCAESSGPGYVKPFSLGCRWKNMIHVMYIPEGSTDST